MTVVAGAEVPVLPVEGDCFQKAHGPSVVVCIRLTGTPIFVHLT